MSGSNGLTQVDSGIFIGSGVKNVTIKDNYFDSNNAGVAELKATNIAIQNNLFTNQKYSQIYLYQGGTINILNNTIDKDAAQEGLSATQTTGLIVKNNLITNNNGGMACVLVSSGYNVTYNDVWNNQGSTGRKLNYLGCKPGANNLNENPQYVGTGANEMEKHEIKEGSKVLTAGENKTRMGWTRPADIEVVDDGTIVMVNGVFYTHSDHLGSSSVTTDSSGAVKQLLSYHPYGTTHFQKDSSDYQNDKKFTGKELDEEFGWYYYGARYYDAEVGRFASTDYLQTLIGTSLIEYITQKRAFFFLTQPQNFNQFSYVINNPLRYKDPTGNQAVEFWVGLELVEIVKAVVSTLIIYGGTKAIIEEAKTKQSTTPTTTAQPTYTSPAQDKTQASTDNAAPKAKSGEGESSPPPAQNNNNDDEEKNIQKDQSDKWKSETTNNKLKNFLDYLFRPEDKLPGGTAGILRNEFINKIVNEAGQAPHLQKAVEAIRGLGELIKGGGLTVAEGQIANTVLNDLQSAVDLFVK